MSDKIGIKLCPMSVSEYSTLGGTTGYTSRCIRPSFSSSRSWLVSIFGVAAGINLCSWLKRNILSARCHSISDLYFPPTISSVASTGHMYVCFKLISPFIYHTIFFDSIYQ